ncbi:MAG: class I SAM-dependent methyltransferase [Gammaproteobacteria bacterium]|jgi:ubiquinone/menaquinone biosynthesis C-methylase UbiE
MKKYSANNKEFKDYFSDQTVAYNAYRPDYPEDMFTYLASIAPGSTLAWDCACGTGQASIHLVKYFQNIIATDASRSQITNAVTHPRIEYRVETAEHSSLQNHSVDLIVVGQALHWFDMTAFFSEARRVLTAEGIFAAWSYNLLTLTPEIDLIINDLNRNILGDYWAPERKLVENNYGDIVFPFANSITEQFTMRENWDFDQLLGYLGTWSAVRSYQQRQHMNPLDLIKDKLQQAWGSQTNTKLVRWPVTLKIGRD